MAPGRAISARNRASHSAASSRASSIVTLHVSWAEAEMIGLTTARSQLVSVRIVASDAVFARGLSGRSQTVGTVRTPPISRSWRYVFRELHRRTVGEFQIGTPAP